jgi:hypothetical protein
MKFETQVSAVAAEQPSKITPAESGSRADVSTFCPNCSAELLGHRCKMVCKRCGFYLSCSDFY